MTSKFYRIRNEKVTEFMRKYPSCQVIKLREDAKDWHDTLLFHYLPAEDARAVGLGKEYGWYVTSARAADIRMLSLNGISWH